MRVLHSMGAVEQHWTEALLLLEATARVERPVAAAALTRARYDVAEASRILREGMDRAICGFRDRHTQANNRAIKPGTCRAWLLLPGARRSPIQGTLTT